MRTRAYVAFNDETEDTTRRPERKRSHRAKVQTRERKLARSAKYTGQVA